MTFMVMISAGSAELSNYSSARLVIMMIGSLALERSVASRWASMVPTSAYLAYTHRVKFSWIIQLLRQSSFYCSLHQIKNIKEHFAN